MVETPPSEFRPFYQNLGDKYCQDLCDATVNLEAGRVYRCQVKGQWVELRVLGPDGIRPLSVYDESDVMLDPWVEFPRPTSGIVLHAKPGSLPLPDVPEIPTDENYS
ncbi:MAG: hypothetical protein ACXVB2_25710 [Isosphaeraceae bacterium]